jgi:hypothetical protein
MGLLDNIKGGPLPSMSNNDRSALALGLASGFAGMSGNPNTASIMAGIGNQQTALRDDRKLKTAQELASSKLQLQTEQAMRLIGQEYPEIAQAIQGGFMTPNEGVMEAMRRRNAPAEKEGELVRQYRLAQEQGYQGNFMDFKTAIARAGADQVSIDARSGSEVGTIPQGYELITDKNGNRRLRAISGGEAAQEIEEQVIKDASKQNTVGRTATIVLEDIGRLKDLLTEQTFLDPVTGPIASQVASGVSASARLDAESLVSTIGGNIGFDRLQLMRNESKTGGALGAINAQEMQLLQDVMGSLKLDQSEAQLRYNLERLESIYTAIIEKASAYPNAAKYGFGNNKTPVVSQTSASSKVTNTPPILTWNPTGGPNGKGAFE